MEAILGLLARHILTALGVLAVAKGYTDDATVQAAIGALSTLAGVGWSIYQKHRSGALTPQ